MARHTRSQSRFSRVMSSRRTKIGLGVAAAGLGAYYGGRAARPAATRVAARAYGTFVGKVAGHAMDLYSANPVKYTRGMNTLGRTRSGMQLLRINVPGRSATVFLRRGTSSGGNGKGHPFRGNQHVTITGSTSRRGRRTITSPQGFKHIVGSRSAQKWTRTTSYPKGPRGGRR